MSLIENLALVVVALAALYLLVLGVMSLVAPKQANRFLLGFAGSPSVHYIELFLRFVVGTAFVIYAPHMFFPDVFIFFGWVLLGTTACLLLVPWRWHLRFAQQTVPRVIRYIALIGVSSLILGGFILVAVVRGAA